MSGFIKSGDEHHRAVKCPFSADRLREMYWKDGWGIPRIAREAALSLGRDRVNDKTVMRWMREAKIDTRNIPEANRVLSKQYGTANSKAARSALADKRAMGKVPKPARFPLKGIAELRRKTRAKAVTERRETRRCCWPSCGKPVTRKSSDFQKSVWFCSRRHSGRFAMGNAAIKQMCLDVALDQSLGIGE